jgi:hypothetical protein
VTNGASVTGTVVFATGALPLGVAIGTGPEPFAPHADAIADLAHQTTVAVGGAGASAALATRTGAHLLDQDPVSAAETRDRALPRSASPGLA